jgi:hypothetical protein
MDLTMWCIKNPANKFLTRTISDNKADCVWKLFDLMPESFQTKYWKKPEESAKAYDEMGYRAVRIDLVERAK